MLRIVRLNMGPLIRVDRPSRKGLKRQRRDKARCGVGHRDGNVGTSLGQPADNMTNLVAGDAAAEADDHAFAREIIHLESFKWS